MGDEADLIRRWQQGDVDAFGTIVRRWQRPIARFLARYLGPDTAVADLTQDVFLRAHRSVGRYRENGVFSTWLYQIALNLARDASRRALRAPAPLPVEVPARMSHDDSWEQRELAQLVTGALAELAEPLREVLVLRHYEGLNFEQMARLLKTPSSTLKSRFAVALSQMRIRLTQLGFSDEGDQQ
jgi:RNA polymerase sigma-70 factor (ECF subfamily)